MYTNKILEKYTPYFYFIDVAPLNGVNIGVEITDMVKNEKHIHIKVSNFFRYNKLFQYEFYFK